MDDCLCKFFPQYCTECWLVESGKCWGFMKVNNMLIKCSSIGAKGSENSYAVYTPDGDCWEDNLTLNDAIEYCMETKDFVL